MSRCQSAPYIPKLHGLHQPNRCQPMPPLSACSIVPLFLRPHRKNAFLIAESSKDNICVCITSPALALARMSTVNHRVVDWNIRSQGLGRPAKFPTFPQPVLKKEKGAKRK